MFFVKNMNGHMFYMIWIETLKTNVKNMYINEFSWSVFLGHEIGGENRNSFIQWRVWVSYQVLVGKIVLSRSNMGSPCIKTCMGWL